jgi:hypothetical protein
LTEAPTYVVRLDAAVIFIGSARPNRSAQAIVNPALAWLVLFGMGVLGQDG